MCWIALVVSGVVDGRLLTVGVGRSSVAAGSAPVRAAACAVVRGVEPVAPGVALVGVVQPVKASAKRVHVRGVQGTFAAAGLLVDLGLRGRCVVRGEVLPSELFMTGVLGGVAGFSRRQQLAQPQRAVQKLAIPSDRGAVANLGGVVADERTVVTGLGGLVPHCRAIIAGGAVMPPRWR